MIKIIDDLNQMIYENNLEKKFSFLIETDGSSFIISLNEVDLYGTKIAMYGDNDSIEDSIEQRHENNEITYEEMVIEQCKLNLEGILKEFQKVLAIWK